MPRITRCIDPVNGNDSNSGETMSRAWRTFGGTAPAAFLSSAPEGSRLVVASGVPCSPSGSSDFTSYVFPSINRNGFTIEPDGDNPLQIFGDAILAETFTHTGSGIWQATIPTGLTIGGALLDHRNVTYSGANGRQLRGGLLLSDASATPALYKYNYNSVTGAFVINTGSAANNPNGRVSIFRPNTFNLITIQGDGCVVRGALLSVAAPLSTVGYAIQGRGFRHLISQVEGHMAGNHPLGYSGSDCVDNAFVDCIAGTGGASSTGFVIHASSGNVSGKLIGGESHARGHIFPDGTTIAGHGGNTGVYMHTGGTNPITSIEVRGIKIYVGNGTDDIGFGMGDTSQEMAAFSGSRTSPDGRPIRFIDVQTFNDQFSYVQGAPLFDRCRFRYTNAGPGGTGVNFGVIRVRGSAGVGCASLPLWQSCEILANLDNASNVISLFQGWNTTALQAGEGPTLVNSTALDVGTGSNQAGIFCPIYANCVMAAYSSVLGFSGGKTTGRLYKADALGNALVADNVYCAIATGAYSDVASRNTAAEFSATTDLTAVHLTSAAAMQLIAGTTSARPKAHSPLFARANRSIQARTDIDGRPVAGNAGCYQFPRFRNRLRSRIGMRH